MLKPSWGLTCEFHAEFDSRPEINNAMQALAHSVSSVNGHKLEFLHRRQRPGLRISIADGTDPTDAAQTMIEFIRKTRAPLEAAYRASS